MCTHIYIYMNVFVNAYIFTCSYIYHSRQETNHRQTTVSLATHCNTLQHTATHCNTLQHTATPCNTLQQPTNYCVFVYAMSLSSLCRPQNHLCMRMYLRAHTYITVDMRQITDRLLLCLCVYRGLFCLCVDLGITVEETNHRQLIRRATLDSERESVGTAVGKAVIF